MDSLRRGIGSIVVHLFFITVLQAASPPLPSCIALALGHEIWIMNVLTGKILQRFTTGNPKDRIQAVVLSTNHLAVSIEDALLFFTPSHQGGYHPLNNPVSSYPTPEGAAHMLKLSQHETFRQEESNIIHTYYAPLIMAAVGDTLYFVGFPNLDRAIVTFPPLKTALPITHVMTAELQNIPSLDRFENDAHLLIIRTGDAERSKVVTAPHLKQLSDPLKATLTNAAKKVPPVSDFPHMVLLTYHIDPRFVDQIDLLADPLNLFE